MDEQRPDEPEVPVVEPEHVRPGRRGRAVPLNEGGQPPDDVAVEGVVVAGVEHGSVVLRGGDGSTWQLGAAHGHLVGCTVALRGRPRRDVMTTAQQGVPIEVLAVEVLAGTPGRRRGAPDQI